MANKSGYKYQIEQALLDNNWELIECGASDEWWDDETWKVRHHYNFETCFYLSFIVDPQFEGQRKKGQGIYEIKASTEVPKNWNDDTHSIAAISMTKRKFDVKLSEFIADLEWFRNDVKH